MLLNYEQPWLHYSSLRLCNHAHFTRRILLYRMHSFSGPLLFHAISLHISQSVLYYSDQSDYGYAVQMSVKLPCCLEFSATPTQWHWNWFKRTVNRLIQITQQNPKTENITCSRRLLICKLHTAVSHQGWAIPVIC